MLCRNHSIGGGHCSLLRQQEGTGYRQECHDANHTDQRVRSLFWHFELHLSWAPGGRA